MSREGEEAVPEKVKKVYLCKTCGKVSDRGAILKCKSCSELSAPATNVAEKLGARVLADKQIRKSSSPSKHKVEELPVVTPKEKTVSMKAGDVIEVDFPAFDPRPYGSLDFEPTDDEAA